jgi:hypothetical protein
VIVILNRKKIKFFSRILAVLFTQGKVGRDHHGGQETENGGQYGG